MASTAEPARKDIVDPTHVVANADEEHAIYIHNGRLYLSGCDCATAVTDVDTARRMVDLVKCWIDAPPAP